MPLGRPPLKSPELIDAICDGLRKHYSRRAACALAGCSESILYRWMAEDPDLVQQIEHAESVSEAKCIDGISACTDVKTQNPQPLEWIAERRHQHQWKLRSDVNVSGKIEVPGLAELSRAARAAVKQHDGAEPSDEVNTENA